MDRRRLLAGLGGGLAGLAGCLGGGEAETATPTPARIAQHGSPSDLCEREVIEEFSIRAIVDPAFADGWAGHEVPRRYRPPDTDPEAPLDPEAGVIGVERDGRSRAYPIPAVWHHEIVNDRLDGPVLVTFCPLCDSGMVARRRVDGAATTFGVSGQLWRPPGLPARAAQETNVSFGVRRRANDSGDADTDVRVAGNLVMFDAATESFWSQLLAQAVCGPRLGTELEQLPARVATWAEWRRDHPETDVLLPPPHSTTM